MSDDSGENGRDDEQAEAVQHDDEQALAPSTDDPIRYLEESLRSNWVTEWRFVGSRHGVYRIGEQSGVSGLMRSRLNFDCLWECDVCRPFKERKEGRRIVWGFEGREMWVSVIDAEDRKRAIRTARRRGIDYVALPVIVGDEVALLTTEPLFDAGTGSQYVEDHKRFVSDVAMPLRWTGWISSSHGFLPSARIYSFWEAHHPGTNRRCWHAHDMYADAMRCAVETGNRLDGSPKGWRVRGCSEWRMMGRIRVIGSRLRELLDGVGILSRESVITDRRAGDDRVCIEFGPIEWEDERFVKLREAAKWTTPKTFRPPPLTLTVRIDVDSGKMTGTA